MGPPAVRLPAPPLFRLTTSRALGYPRAVSETPATADPAREPRSGESSEARLVELVQPHQTNHFGTLFGGHALGLMDRAGFIAATRFARRTMVTVAVDRIEFKVPVRAGQMVELVARVTEVGRTSLTTGIEMFVEDLLSGERRLATTGRFVFVALDDQGRPIEVRPGASTTAAHQGRAR